MALITNAGKDLDADHMDGTVAIPANWYVAIGTGGTAEAAGNTALQTEVETRIAATKSQPSSTVNQFLATFTATAGRTIVECGLFDASTAGVCFMRDTAIIGTVVLATGDQLTLRVQIGR